jgi:hypothetical protein
MRGLDLERRWRVGAYFYSLSVCLLFIFLKSCYDIDGFFIHWRLYRRSGNMRTAVRSPYAWPRMCSPRNSVDVPRVLVYSTLTPRAL